MLTAEIDLSVIKSNVATIKRRVKTEYYAVVKADAYGHGAVAVAKAIQSIVEGFAVATDVEAMELVENGIKRPILILGTGIALRKLSKNVIPSVADVEQIERLKGVSDCVHVAVNTGMNRYGCKPEDFGKLIMSADNSGIKVAGAFTHFYREIDKNDCAEQFDKFLSCVLPFRERIRRLHCCASNCLILPEVYHLDAVRVGLAMYGWGYDDVQPAMKIFTEITQINYVNKGEHIGYGDYVAEKDMRVATVRLGYGDGFWRRSEHELVVNGRYCPVVGSVCMDACMIDVSEVRCKIGDRAYILSDNEQMKRICVRHNTISHEVLTMISRRIKRKYVNN